ncbi:Protein CBG25076, partial [Caenorhabditis briggsae]
GNFHNYVCSVNGTSPDPRYKRFINFSKKLRNCGIQVTMAQMFMFQKDENSFLDYNKERSPYFKFSEICITDWEKFWKKLLQFSCSLAGYSSSHLAFYSHDLARKVLKI